MEPAQQAIVGFVTLLLLPFLGVLGLFAKRATKVLGLATVAWGLGGWVYLRSLSPLDPAYSPTFRAWRVGLLLGAAFFAVAWLARRPRVARGLKIAFAVTSVVVFLKALHLYLHSYA